MSVPPSGGDLKSRRTLRWVFLCLFLGAPAFRLSGTFHLTGSPGSSLISFLRAVKPHFNPLCLSGCRISPAIPSPLSFSRPVLVRHFSGIFCLLRTGDLRLIFAISRDEIKDTATEIVSATRVRRRKMSMGVGLTVEMVSPGFGKYRQGELGWFREARW